MAAALDNPALVHHVNQIGVLNGREPVRDNERRAAFLQFTQSFLNGALGLIVEG